MKNNTPFFRALFPGIYPFLVLLLLALHTRNLPAQETFFAELQSVHQVDFRSPFQLENSEFGLCKIRYKTPPDSVPVYFNLVYLSEFSSPSPEWSIQNLPLLPVADTMEVSAWFDLDPSNTYPDHFAFEYILLYPVFSLQPFSQPPPVGFFTDYLVTPHIHALENNGVSPGTHFPGDLLSIQPFPWPPSFPLFEVKSRGCNVPNIDLDSLKYMPFSDDFPGYVGDWDACVPAATANSVGWLRDQHHVIDSILAENVGDDSLSLRRTLVELSEWMNRPIGDGVDLPDMVGGKLGFFDDLELPIRVKFQATADTFQGMNLESYNFFYDHFAENQSDTTGTDEERISREWLMQELCDGEDLEMNFNCCWYLDGEHQDGNCWAHTVNLIGMGNFGGFSAIQWKDDERQDTTGGMRTFTTGLRRDTVDNVIYHILESMSDTITTDTGTWVQRCFISEVISESYDPTVTFEEVNALDELTSPSWQLLVYPNPAAANSLVRLQVRLPKASPVLIRISDLRGSLLYSKTIPIAYEGKIYHELPAELPKGFNILEVRTAFGKKVRKILLLE